MAVQLVCPSTVNDVIVRKLNVVLLLLIIIVITLTTIAPQFDYFHCLNKYDTVKTWYLEVFLLKISVKAQRDLPVFNYEQRR
jgi:hypothetical protein